MKKPKRERKISIPLTESDLEKLRQAAYAVSELARIASQLPACDENNAIQSFSAMTDSYLWRFYQEIEERMDKANKRA